MRDLRPTVGLSQLLDAAGVGPDSAIRVTGSGALFALLWLHRRGYADVGCLHAGQRAPGDEADALLAAHTATVERLSDLLHRGPQVRQGGIIIVQTRSGEGGAQAVLTFHRHGFELVRRLPGSHRDVLVARRTLEFRQAA
ncbi:hypothetical protein [Phenylobacterium koreense]|uniref:Rhodanese domain-containing protein n=1 Tax=Phenylobacterium koreense TaxID=266125 RepID=A0ABV2EHC3_9CAUL